MNVGPRELPVPLRVSIGVAHPHDVALSLRRYHVDICFLGCSGVSASKGFSMRDTPEAEAARAWLDVASTTVVLADASKIGRDTLARFAGAGEIDVLVTDERIDGASARALRDAGVDVRIAALDAVPSAAEGRR